MVRNLGNFVENSFVNGLVTEATGLSFPENAVTDCDNVVFNDDGSVERRLGIDFESGYSTATITYSGAATNEYVWTSAGGDGDITFVVTQVGSTLSFYRVSTSGAVSANKHATTVSLTTYKISGAPDTKTDKCSFASGKGYLFVTHRYCTPFYVKYTSSSNTFTVSSIAIRIRDLEGVSDGLSVTSRPSTLSSRHAYNLDNQGWRGNTVYNSDGDQTDKVSRFNTENGVYPSNSDVWFLFLNTGIFNSDRYFSQGDNGATEAPKGYFILDPFDTNRDSASGFTVTEKTSGYERPSCCAFFAGRAFYSGVKADGYSGEIYFTQIIDSDTQLAKCYQAQDPTSQHNSDLLPNDGGVIKILDAGEIYAMFSSQRAIIVLASNGVWAISGSEAGPFSAEDYLVRKLGSLTNIAPASIIDVLGSPMFWAQGAIWTVTYENGEYLLQNASDGKIKSFIDAIPSASKPWVKGAYNRTTGIAQWLYRSTAPSTTEDKYSFDKSLCLNIKTGAYYPQSFTTSTNRLHGIVATENTNRDIVFKFFTSKASGSSGVFTFAEIFDTDYIDWDTDGNTAYTSYLFSGYKPVGDGNKEFQSNYVVFHLETATNSSAYVRGIWDYATSALSNKWTAAQQIYNSTPTYRSHRMRKVKIRGWGKLLQYYVYSEAGKPFHIDGWSVSVSSNQST